MYDSSARTIFGHVITALDAMKIGYLHLREPTPGDLATGTVQVEHVAESFRPLTSVPIIANTGFDKAKATAVLQAGSADLVAFGVPFIANPDLVARLRRDAPFNKPDPSTFYGIGSKGYTDYPMLADRTRPPAGDATLPCAAQAMA